MVVLLLRGKAMVKVDLKRSDEHIIELIKERCSSFGSVVSVKLRRNQSPLAMVKMATRDEAIALAIHEAGSLVGSTTKINLA